MRNPAATYRQLAVEGASPLELVVMLYDRAIADLQRAMTAVEAHDIQQRTDHLNHFFSILAQLEGSLDHERGGEVAKDLETFYQIAKAQALNAAIKNSKEILSELSEHFATLRDAWQEGERHLAAQGASSPT
jgi:flagellar protein FliS